MWILRYHNGYELDSRSENPGSIPGRKHFHRCHPALLHFYPVLLIEKYTTKFSTKLEVTSLKITIF